MSWNCIPRGAFLCCIRCYSGRGLYPVREKSFSYVTVLRSRIGADLSRRQFSLSATTSASTRTHSTESLPADSGLETNSDVITEAVLNVIPQQGELSSLGLGGYTPVGLIQTTLEFLHDHAHLSWWLSIVAVTVALKAALFLPSVAMQINAAKLANLQPHLQEVNQRMAAYRAAGDQQGVLQESQKLLRLYNEHGCNPMKMFLMPMLQMPIFVSFFMALRGMAQLPVHSMKTGGTLWFTDLTIPDPTFALPVLACASFILNIELGGEGGSPSTNEVHRKMKLFLRVMALVILPVSSTFPSALFMYWVTNGLLSTAQILLLKVPTIKKALGIPRIIHSTHQLPPPTNS